MSTSLDDLFDQPRGSRLRDLIKFAQDQNLQVGSTTGGHHNRGSKHYKAQAIDLANSGSFPDDQVQQLSQAASNAGLKLRDERRRPRGQAVWGGPHLHLETDDQSLNDLFDTSVGQTPPPIRQTKQSTPSASPGLSRAPSAPRPAYRTPFAPVTAERQEAIRRGVADFERPPLKPPTGRAGALLRQYGQTRGIENLQRRQEEATRKQVEQEYNAPSFPGFPNLYGASKLVSAPLEYVQSLFRSDKENIAKETAARLRQQQVAETTEAQDIRRGYGKMSAAGRIALAPLDRLTASVLGNVAGVSSAFGIAPNRLSDWANKRAEVLEAASSAAPLAEERTLSSLVTGKPELKEVERGIPEKVLTGIADLGVSVGQLALLREATGLSLTNLLTLEGAARANDKPIGEQLAAAGQARILGTILEKHLGRVESAGLFAIPTAAQTGYEVAQGRMSPLDAAIQTGIQAGAGAVLGGGKRRAAESEPRVMEETPTQRRTAQIEATEADREAIRGEMRLAERPHEQAFRERQAARQGNQSKGIEDLFDEPQSKVKPPVEAQRAEVESRPATERTDMGREGAIGIPRGQREPPTSDVGTELPQSTTPQRFFHRDYGEVVESPNQKRVGKGRVRVTAEDGSEHVIKRSAMTGRGNERAVPIRPESSIESQDRPAAESVTQPSPAGAATPEVALPKTASTPDLTSEQVLRANHDLLSSPKFREHLFQESISGNAGEGRAAVNAAIDKQGKVVRLGNIQDFPQEVRDKLDSGEYSHASFIVRDALTGEPAVERAVLSKPTPGQPQQVTSDWYVDLEDPSRSTGNVPPEFQEISRARQSVTKPVTNPPLESTTAAKKSAMAEDRAALDLPELPAPERKSWQRSLDNAKSRGLNRRADVLADEVLNKPRGLDDEETAGLTLRAQELKNDHARVMEEIAAAKDAETITSRVAERDAIESAFDKLSRAIKSSGTEKGRTLAAQKLTINRDYDPVSVLSRAKAAKKRSLTDTERAEYETLTTRNKQLEDQLAQAQQASESKTIQREIDRVYRRRERRSDKKTLDAEAVVIRQRIAEAWMKVKSPDSTVQPSGLGRLDPLVEPVLDYARNRVRAGVIDAGQLVDDVYEAVKDVAEISKRDIRQMISGYGLEPRRQEHSQAAVELARIRKELRGLLEREDIAAGRRSPRREGPTLREGTRKEGPPSQEARRQRLEQRAVELEAQLASGSITQPMSKPRPMPTEEVFRLERRITENKQRIEEKLAHDGENTINRLGRRIRDALGLYRAVETSFDLSWMLRQGKIGLARHPSLWSRAAIEQFKGFSNDKYFRAAKEIESDPEFRYLNKFGLETPSVDSVRVGSPTHTRAEEYQTELAHKIPAIRQFEQVYNIGLDTLRTLWGKHDLQMLRKAGFNPDSPADFKVFREAMQQINDMTGRTNLERIIPGKLGQTANRATPAINVLTYAVRFWASRLKVLTSPLDPRMYPQLKSTKGLYESMPRVQRVEAWKRLFAFYGLVGAQMAAGKYLLGFDIDLDPDSPDFGKLRRGKRVYDISAGTLSHLRFAARMIKRVYEAKTGQKATAPSSTGDVLGTYLRSKESPIAGRVHDIFLSRRTKEGYGTDFKGEPVYPTGKPGTRFMRRLKDARLLPRPLGLEDAIEAYEQLGWGGVAGSVPATVLGEGVQTYPKKAKKKKFSGYK